MVKEETPVESMVSNDGHWIEEEKRRLLEYRFESLPQVRKLLKDKTFEEMDECDVEELTSLWKLSQVHVDVLFQDRQRKLNMRLKGAERLKRLAEHATERQRLKTKPA